MQTQAFPRVEYVADLRGFVFTGGLTNKTRTESNPYGEHSGWAIGDPGTIYNHLDLGMDRTILRQPVGPGTTGWVLFSSWHPLSNEQKEDFTNGVNAWKKEKAQRRVGVFFGRDCTDALVRRDINIPEGPLLSPNPRDTQSWLWWCQNTEPLRYIGVDEFWLDRGSANDNAQTRLDIIQLARMMRYLYGVKIGIEAIPMQDERSDGPDWDYMTKVPAMGRWRNLWHTWIKHGYRNTLVVPRSLRGKIEVHCFLHNSDIPPPTTGDRNWLEAAGWTISWLNSIQELQDGPITEPPETGNRFDNQGGDVPQTLS